MPITAQPISQDMHAWFARIHENERKRSPNETGRLIFVPTLSLGPARYSAKYRPSGRRINKSNHTTLDISTFSTEANRILSNTVTYGLHRTTYDDRRTKYGDHRTKEV